MTKSIEQSVKQKLKAIANDQERSFAEIWQAFILERFLVRVSLSKYQSKLIFKGGLCLQKYLKLGRSTMDLDFLVAGIKSNTKEIEKVFQEISKIHSDDGLVFSNIKVSPLIHPHMKYPGYAISILAALGSTRTPVSIDLGIGDVVIPEDLTIELVASKKGPLFEKEIKLLAYSPEAIFAEKYETAIKRDALNSRMKDYHDLTILIESGLVQIVKLKIAIQNTFTNRNTNLTKLPEFTGADYNRIQKLWENHLKTLRKNINSNNLPQEIKDVIMAINNFLEPIFSNLNTTERK